MNITVTENINEILLKIGCISQTESPIVCIVPLNVAIEYIIYNQKFRMSVFTKFYTEALEYFTFTLPWR